jgi:glycosyltransferase involved in cell wall biosynthesis
MTKDIAFATYDWAMGVKPIEPNGCAWYRCELPKKELLKHGWEARIGHPQYFPEKGFGLTDVHQNEMSYGYKIVVFKLIMLKQVLEIMRDEKRNKDQKIVVDIDDFYEGLTEHNLAWKNTDPSRSDESNREHYLSIIDEADYLTVSTQFLYDYYTKEKGKTNVFLIRNGIDIGRWRRRGDYSRYLPTVGWVGATPWRSLDLEQLQPFFGKFMSENRLPFHHAGHIDGHSVVPKLGLNADTKFTHEPRKIISQYPQMFRKIDIGIVPLNDIPFNHAKSTIKGLEYAAAGIPFIASRSPEYELLASQGVGRVAGNEDEWVGHLTELLDPRIRKEEIEKNYENLKAMHTMEKRGIEWNEAMNIILDNNSIVQ